MGDGILLLRIRLLEVFANGPFIKAVKIHGQGLHVHAIGILGFWPTTVIDG